VSHDCDILSDDTPSHFYIFVFVCRIEMSFISLQTEIDFIKNVVIYSFGDPAPFPVIPGTSNDEIKILRIDWIRTSIDSAFPNLSGAEKNQLIWLSNTIHTLEKAEDILDKAKAERDRERQFLLQQGEYILFHSFSFFLLTS
jgi:hypothetical protein